MVLEVFDQGVVGGDAASPDPPLSRCVFGLELHLVVAEVLGEPERLGDAGLALELDNQHRAAGGRGHAGDGSGHGGFPHAALASHDQNMALRTEAHNVHVPPIVVGARAAGTAGNATFLLTGLEHREFRR